MNLVLVDKTNYKDAIAVQNSIFPSENGTLNILASLDRKLFINVTGLLYPDDNIKYYLAKSGGEYVGITGIYNYNYDLDSAWLGWFGILKKFRNKGMGRELLIKTVELAVSMGFKYMRLYTDFIDNQAAISLYEKEGFVGEKYTIEKLPYDCRIYSKDLVGNGINLWGNKNLGLSYQSELDHMSEERLNEIVKKYEAILET